VGTGLLLLVCFGLGAVMYLAVLLFTCYVILPAIWTHAVCKKIQNDRSRRYAVMGMVAILAFILIVFCFEGQLK